MTWMTLDTDRKSDDAVWLRDSFPVDYSKYPHPMLGGDRPTRALDWSVKTHRPCGWVDLTSGSLMLIEAIGTAERGGGTITARLWIAPANRIVQLADPRRYTDEETPEGGDYSAVLGKVLTDITARLPHEIIPGLTPSTETGSAV
jgi:hypothetical protein